MSLQTQLLKQDHNILLWKKRAVTGSTQLTKAIIIEIKHAPVLTVSRGYNSRFLQMILVH